MSTNKNESDTPLPTSATLSQEEETEHAQYPFDEEPTEEEMALILHVAEVYREVDCAAHLNDASIVAEAMRVWERDEEKILEYLKNVSKKNDPTP